MTEKLSTIRPRRMHAAFTMVEIVVTIAVVALMFVAAMNAVGASRTTLLRVGEQSRAHALAHELMQEILAQPYRDPHDPSSFGPTSTESNTGDRSLFNDVDDYDGWRAAPPETIDGEPLGGHDRFARSVAVTRVDPAELGPVGYETGIKRITVTVTRGGVAVAEVTALRTDGLRREGVR